MGLTHGKYPDRVNKIICLLEAHNISYQVKSFKEPAHHASEAASLLQCALGAIVKSLVFTVLGTKEVVLVLVSGKNRADVDKLQRILGKPVSPADPKDVLNLTGYPVGSVPPFGLDVSFPAIIDADLMEYDFIWAAAGSEKILFEIAPSDLKKLSRGRIHEIKQQ